MPSVESEYFSLDSTCAKKLTLSFFCFSLDNTCVESVCSKLDSARKAKSFVFSLESVREKLTVESLCKTVREGTKS